MSKPLDPLRLPLRGSLLIEASAGTGKTWTIAALYLRLVLGHGEKALLPEQILVMTFTRAATRELSERIRARLTEAAACFRGEREPDERDLFLQQLLHDYFDEKHRLQAAWCLSNAAESMDTAAIFTIDAWCQRMLREHAFDSGSLFDEKLVADERSWTDLAVRDVWRQQIYPLTGETLDGLLAIWPTVEKLKADMERRLPRLESTVSTPPRSLAEEWQEQQNAPQENAQELIEKLKDMAALHVQHRLQTLKNSARTFGFRDMLERLDLALAGPRGDQLRTRILQQYPVALIDEFQDTSRLQYSLFDRLYRIATNDRETAILLIGDPKQSIYAFRGADIQSYIQAREATAGRHYVLTTNYRSVHALVAGVNKLFCAAEDREGCGAFRFRKEPDHNPVPFLPNDAHGREERLLRGTEPMPAMEIVYGTAVESKTNLLQHFGRACAEQIATLLNDPQIEFEAEDNGQGKRRPLRPADIAILIRDRTEADAVRKELRRRGIASVYLSDKESVLTSPEAKDLLHWLRAVAEPRNGRLARAAFATALMDKSLPEMAALATNDTVFEKHLDLLQQFHQTWRRQGVLPMLRQTLHQLKLPSRWLAQEGGERRLTNFLHLAEILQDASVQLDGERALIRWLAEAIADSEETDEAIVRLESEADLVQVVTIHKAKGLEYPIVFVPFATTFRSAKEEGSTSKKDAEEARLQEDLRLLYVAVTRARHALWLGVGATKVGNTKKCQLYKSAMGHLLGATEKHTDPKAIPGLLMQVFSPDPDPAWRISPVVAAEDIPCTRFQERAAPPALMKIDEYDGKFERDWGISSFSGIVRDLAALSAQAQPLQISMEEEPTVPVPVLPDVVLQDTARHRFPRGSLPGKFLHEQLAWLAEERFALAGNGLLREQLQQRCIRQGWGRHAEDVCTWLEEVVTTPLPGVGAALRDIRQFLPEMEFWFPVTNATTEAVDALCTQHLLPGVPRPALTARRLRGLLMGFADLVLFWEGRYWVVDYKSNALGANDAAYDPDTLMAAVAQHRYEVQAILYLLALHRLLRLRLGAKYDPVHQLGGAMDWFLRGIAGPANGACLLPVDLELLDSLDAVFCAEAVK